ncbi:MAG: 30S ribosomal protein S12 methylthiotransferase RimO [Rhodospirillaceae bacterium]|nr:30S ribosomal protein S12 methylthiotransferase RimO [Rhodospirillaceae bacterium]MBT6609144.1 30S ribosomal protein S12 methylthiotransferase RimO [Rhodospirillaceae bacterium]
MGIVSLGCPKALVDSERILTKLRAEGYEISGTYAGADAVIVNTCGFLDSAKKESLEAIGEALDENGRVIVTGCLGADEEIIRAAHPDVLAVSGPHQYEAVMEAVHDHLPPAHDPYADLVPPEGIRLTPRHYAYLKISEGCNQTCAFCIIPSMRGKLRSRPANEVVAEAERLVNAGVRELLVISQDTGAYGSDLKYAESPYKGQSYAARITDLCRALGEMGVWIRLHYIYPYPHIDDLIPLMAEGLILPYLDIPFQHASHDILKAMRRPAHQEKTLDRLQRWRTVAPDIAIRSTFIVGFPGETEDDFSHLLQWLEAAELDRVGCFKYEDVEGARSNALASHVDEEVKDERWERLMETQRRISAKKTAAKIGQTFEVIIDDADVDDGAWGRTYADAPEIDGRVNIPGSHDLRPGDNVSVKINSADDYDLFGEPV